MLIQTTRYTLFLLFKTLYMQRSWQQWPASKREFTRKRTATRSLLFITLARVTYKMCWRNDRLTSTVLIDGPCSHTDEFSVAYATRLYRLHTARELRVHRGQFSSHDPRYIQLYSMDTMARLIYTGNS